MTVGVGEDGAGPEGRAFERHRVKIAGVVTQRRASGAGVYPVHDPAAGLPEDAGGSGSADKRLVDLRRVAAWWSMGAAPAAGAIADGEAELPGEVGAQKVRQVGAIRLGGKLAVLPLAQVVMEEVAPRIAQHGLKRWEAERYLGRVIEQMLDPGGVERLR